MTTETSKSKLILKGRENYLELTRRFEAMVEIDEWESIVNGKFIEASPAKGKEVKKWVITNLSDEAIRPVTTLQNIQEKLNEVFGYSNYNSVTQKQFILSFIEFPIVKDPTLKNNLIY